MLDRDEDMLITGGRHPFLARYKVLVVGSYVGAEGECHLTGKPGDEDPGILGCSLMFFTNTCRSSKKK